MRHQIDTNNRVRGFARLALVWLLGCLTVGGGLLASGFSTPGRPEQARPALVTKSIEEIRVGDWVLAKDPNENGPPTPHEVIALPRNWTEHIAHVRVAGGELRATRGHPFWVRNRGWVKAEDLKPGDVLQDSSARSVTVEAVTVEDRVANTYNLTVEGVHTFYAFAGATPILVHNVNPWDFGNYNDLAADSVGDGLDIHHYPQAQPASETIPGYDPQTGLAVAVPHDEHMGMNGTNYQSGEFNGTTKDLLNESKQNMQNNTSIPDDELNALDKEAQKRYGPPCD